MTTLRSDAAENRRRLITAAEQMFAEHGLDAGVEEIAKLAGVGVGTLYRRFPTKDALIAELVRELLNEVLDIARAAQSALEGAGLLEFLYATAAAQARHRGCLARLWNDDETAVIKSEIRRVMGQLLADGQRHGQIRQDASTTDLDLIFWSLPGVIEATDGLEVAWRRHLAITVAGLRLNGHPLTDRALTLVEVEAIKNPKRAR